ncbi:MAG TPA: MBL fold metallo-hydrolase, partial [Xanthobacteraceae bacterium]|nr:MBL fold metallo-hydrolase [Xanthobacteraceae bacterium]
MLSSRCMAGWARNLAIAAAAFAACVALYVAPARAQQSAPAPPATSDLSDRCPGFVAADAPRVVPAALRLAALADGEVRLTYVGHSTFLIESPKLVRIATDYNDYVRPPLVPDIVTMNHAHSTHYTDHPDPAIKYVLRGWAAD